jgi:hypothetical protein
MSSCVVLTLNGTVEHEDARAAILCARRESYLFRPNCHGVWQVVIVSLGGPHGENRDAEASRPRFPLFPGHRDESLRDVREGKSGQSGT